MNGEQQQPQQQMPEYSSIPMRDYGSSIVLLTNPEDQLYKMELTFRGMRVNEKDEVIDTQRPLMNDYGISCVLGMVQSVVSQVMIMGHLGKYDIQQLMDFLGDTLARDLMVNYVDYQILDDTARDKIYFTSLTTAFSALRRALEEGDRRFWKGSVQEYHTKVENENPNRSIIGRIAGWNK